MFGLGMFANSFHQLGYTQLRIEGTGQFVHGVLCECQVLAVTFEYAQTVRTKVVANQVRHLCNKSKIAALARWSAARRLNDLQPIVALFLGDRQRSVDQ